MRIINLLLLCASFAQSLPQFDVNLDLPPQERWVEVAAYYKNELPVMMAEFEKAIDKKIDDYLPAWKTAVMGNIDQDHILELQGIVSTAKDPRVSLQRLIFLQMLYELGSPTLCSGVLAAKQDGTMIHGRNMDYSFEFKMENGKILNWPDVTYDVIYWKGGEKIMTSTNWPGRIGLNTGMRFGGWSFSQNTRSSKNDWKLNLKAAENNGLIYGLEIRRIVETVPDFEDAVKRIYDTNFIAPFFLVMAGAKPYQGAVLTIDRGGVHHKTTPPILRVSKDLWHLVQTNVDQSGFLPTMCPRWVTANALLAKARQGLVNSESVSQLMHTAPIYNNMTVFTWVGEPATGFHSTELYSPADMRAALAHFGTLPLLKDLNLRSVRDHVQ